MKFRILKKARVVISLIFFLLITFVFIDFTNVLVGNMLQGILYLQFIPSLVNFMGLLGISAAGFIFISILSLIFGRVYCSSICPLGTLQDIMIWINNKLGRGGVHKKQKTFRFLRYSILLLTAILLISGLVTPLLFLDPYSNFGRIIANLFRPLYLLANNLGALTLESMEIYTLYRVEPGITNLFSIAFSLTLFFLLLWLSMSGASDAVIVGDRLMRVSTLRTTRA